MCMYVVRAYMCVRVYVCGLCNVVCARVCVFGSSCLAICMCVCICVHMYVGMYVWFV